MIILKHYQKSNIAIFGLGITGLSTAESLLLSGANVFLFDDKKIEELESIKALLNKYPKEQISFNDYNNFDWKKIDTLVLSPGVPLLKNEHPVVSIARKNNCRIIGDIELFWEAKKDSSTFICITGTNGKSTTASLIAHILKNAGRSVCLVGNIGKGVLSAEDVDFYVIELSSFQLDLLDKAIFDIGIILNITPDHLDRYINFDSYCNSKKRILYKQKILSVINVDDLNCANIANTIKNKILTVSSSKSSVAEVFLDENKIINKKNNKILTVTDNPIFPLNLNRLSVISSYAACSNIVTDDEILSGIESFTPLEHRMEIVCKYDNILFINDSKATNIDSTLFALKSILSFNCKIYWIAGGKDKNCNIENFDLDVLKKVEKSFTIGDTGTKLSNFLTKNNISNMFCHDLKNALSNAIKIALDSKEESIIILSPSFASFDQWINFEDRGNNFKKMIMEYIW